MTTIGEEINIFVSRYKRNGRESRKSLMGYALLQQQFKYTEILKQYIEINSFDFIMED